MIPFYSIIIPTYNSAATVTKCLNSIYEQTFKKFEVIVIDGNSSDDTVFLLEKYTDRYPSLKFISENDNGIYYAMNKGIKMAQGEWLYFLGSDDELENKHILQHIHQIEKGNAKLLYGNVRVIGTTTWAKDGCIYDGKFSLKKILITNICQQGIFYHQDCFENKTSLYNTEYKLCSDWDFNLRCWANVPCLYIDLIVAKFFAGGESTRTSVDIKFMEDFMSNIKEYFGPNYPPEVALFLFRQANKRILRNLKKIVKINFHNIKHILGR